MHDEAEIFPFRLSTQTWPDRLFLYLDRVLPGLFQAPLSLEPMSGGRSNPTFRLTSGTRRFVLRCPPPGSLDKTAHRIEREYTVQSALRPQDVPVADLYHLCKDDRVIGTQFYVMKFVEGRVIEDPRLECLAGSVRETAYLNAISTLARLHSVDWSECPELRNFGRPGGFLRRQLGRFGDQLDRYPAVSNHALIALRQRLEQTLPEEDRTALVHGDFRTGNLVIGPSGDIRAVLDWELSTLGDPLVDLAHFLIPYRLPHDNFLVPGMKGIDPAEVNLPSEATLINAYLDLSGQIRPGSWPAYKAFSLYRFSVITGGALLRRAAAESRCLNDEERGGLLQFAEAGLAAAHEPPGDWK